jgi:uncharacterized protein
MQLRDVYAPAIERARKKSLRQLDAHCRRFIELSPFVCMGTVGSGGADVTPRGDQPGFVLVLDETTLAMPDWPGNNRLDSLENLEEDSRVGLLFMIPGFEESLRVNGRAEISFADDLLARWERRPKSALLIRVEEAFLHCGKAMIRSRLWDPAARVERSALPSYGQMMKDQIEIGDTAAEIEASVAEGYRDRLY